MLTDPPSYPSGTPEPLRGEEHPLWARQVEMERGMLHAGADRVRDRVIRATERKQMTRLDPVRGLLADWLPAVAEDLKAWCRSFDKARGPKPIALAKLRETPFEWTTPDGDKRTAVLADPHVMALVALRTVLDSITTERNAITGIAMEIGRNIEHEQQVRLWESADPDLFYSVQDFLKRSDATSGHRKRVNINRFNHLMATGQLQVEWQKWNQEMLLRVGIALIDSICRATGWFSVEPASVEEARARKNYKPKTVLVANPELNTWLSKQLDALELRSPVYKPTVIPPKPWKNTREGGYWTPYVRTPRLIRFKAHQEQQKDWAADEYEAIAMPQVYEAINYLQDRPWRINRRLFEVMGEAYRSNMGIAGLPLKEPLARPERPAEADTDEEAEKQWKRATSRIIQKDIKRLAKEMQTDRLLGVAFEYLDFEEIFFPHMMDFRGRMYPIPVGLQPQGDDISRALLEFAHGKPLTEANGGGAWLAVHLSACWGFDKASYEDRISWVEERNGLWRRIAADPLGNLEWAATSGPGKVDKPWCVLAAIFDWVSFLEEGYGYCSHTPVSVDGTCNGIQHLSAMTRDEVAGEYVNLVPGPKPRDIYKFVANELQAVLVEVERLGGANSEHARYWLDLCNWDLPRGLTKRQVMVVPYGGTKDSFFNYTREWLDKEDPLPEGLDFKLETTKALLLERSQRVAFLVAKMWDVVRRVVSGGMQVMEWLQKTAKATTKGNQPIFWTTPSGFVVRHFYGEQKLTKVNIMLDGQTLQLAQYETTKDLDAPAQLRGIAPNFVHSLDAAALTLTLLAAKERGLDGLTSVHDAYGTHAADMWPLYHILREAFVLVHAGKGSALAGFRESCAAVVIAQKLATTPELDFEKAGELASADLPPLPEMGRLDLADVLSSDYFFA